jgi:hypothetical protein
LWHPVRVTACLAGRSRTPEQIGIAGPRRARSAKDLTS